MVTIELFVCVKTGIGNGVSFTRQCLDAGFQSFYITITESTCLDQFCCINMSVYVSAVNRFDPNITKTFPINAELCS